MRVAEVMQSNPGEAQPLESWVMVSLADVVLVERPSVSQAEDQPKSFRAFEVSILRSQAESLLLPPLPQLPESIHNFKEREVISEE